MSSATPRSFNAASSTRRVTSMPSSRRRARPTLRRFFATTNCIENLIGTVRHVTRNIKRWRDGDMRRRWIGLGLLRAAERFRRIKRHGELDVLVTALGAANLAERAA